MDTVHPLIRTSLADTENIICDIYPLIEKDISLFEHEDVSALDAPAFLSWCMERLNEVYKDTPFFIVQNKNKPYSLVMEHEYGSGGVHIGFRDMFHKMKGDHQKLFIDVCSVCRKNFSFWWESYLFDTTLDYQKDCLQQNGEFDAETLKEIQSIVDEYDKGEPDRIRKMIKRKKNRKLVGIRLKAAKRKAKTKRHKAEIAFFEQMLFIHDNKLSVTDAMTKKMKIEDGEEDMYYGPVDTHMFVWTFDDFISEQMRESLNEAYGNMNIANPIEYCLPGEEPQKFEFYRQFEKLYDLYHTWNKL